MKDLGSLVGSMMVSLLRARRMADEETAKLAEIYKANPLLEGLSIPRIRIPELTIDLPLLIEGSEEAEEALLADKQSIIKEAVTQLNATAEKEGITIDPKFVSEYKLSITKQINNIDTSLNPVFRESVSRATDQALIDAHKAAATTFSSQEKKILATDQRYTAYKSSIAKESVPPSILSNITTADVKEKASKENVVRLKVTFKEEGLEWATSASESGGVSQTLQPE